MIGHSAGTWFQSVENSQGRTGSRDKPLKLRQEFRQSGRPKALVASAITKLTVELNKGETVAFYWANSPFGWDRDGEAEAGRVVRIISHEVAEAVKFRRTSDRNSLNKAKSSKRLE